MVERGKVDKSILVPYFLCAWTWMRRDEQLPLQEGTKEVLSSKENKVLVRSEVEGPLNEEARNIEF